MSGGQFDWGGRLLKSNGGAQRFPQHGRKSCEECKGKRKLDCKTYRSRLEHPSNKGSIPTLPPARLASCILWLLPILYMFKRYSISSYSEAPWGLSVLSRVTRIFTGIIISPSLSLRQCPDRYAFRAGRNLPDKEFRYLRTVIVTAAVYWGFNSELRLR